MKKFLLLASLVLLSACTPTTNSIDGDFVKPSQLQDCQFYRMRDTSGVSYVVVRCPNSSTSTTTSGKNKRTVVVIDGKEYEEKK